jgi:SpoVK/Ycf46/Vps4 family AAA+-type ATPase
MPLEGDFDLDQLVRRTDGFSGAEIVGACSEAAMLAIEAQSQYLLFAHMLEAIASVKPQITESMLQFYKTCAANLS